MSAVVIYTELVPVPRPSSDITLREVHRSEQELGVLLEHASQLHEAAIAHDALSCLICFGAAN